MTQALATVQYKPTDLTTDRLGEVLAEAEPKSPKRRKMEERYASMVAEARDAGIPDDIVPDLDLSWGDDTLSVTGATLKDLLEQRRVPA